MRTEERQIVDKPLMITSSLLDSVSFAVTMRNNPEWGPKSMEGLRATLNRTGEFKETPFTIRGKEFEDQLCSFSRVQKDKFLEHMAPFCQCDVQKLAPFYDAITGGQFQRTVKQNITAGGQQVFLYGKEDVWHPGRIADIKTTSKWKTGMYSSEDEYRKRSQHSIYMTLDGVHDFDYLIGEFMDLNAGLKNKEPEWVLIDTHIVTVHIDDLEAEKERLAKRIETVLDFFWQDEEMWYNLCNIYTRSFK